MELRLSCPAGIEDLHFILNVTIHTKYSFRHLSPHDLSCLADDKTFFSEHPKALVPFFNTISSNSTFAALFRNRGLPEDEVHHIINNEYAARYKKTITHNPAFHKCIMGLVSIPHEAHPAVCYDTLLLMPFFAEEALKTDVHKREKWKIISLNRGIKFTPALVAKYHRAWSWTHLIQNPAVSFSVDEIRQHIADGLYLINDTFLATSALLSKEDVFQHFVETDEFDLGATRFDHLSSNNHIRFTADVISAHKDKWNFGRLSQNTGVVFTSSLLLEFKDKWDWELVSKNPSLFKHDPKMLGDIVGYLTTRIWKNREALKDVDVSSVHPKSVFYELVVTRIIAPKEIDKEAIKLAMSGTAYLSRKSDGSDIVEQCEILMRDIDEIPDNTSILQYAGDLIEQYKAQRMPEETVCPICKEKTQLNQIVFTVPCMHLFHRKCINDWQGSSCPVCRTELSNTRTVSWNDTLFKFKRFKTVYNAVKSVGMCE